LQRYAPDIGKRFGLETPAELPDEPTKIEVAESAEDL